MKCQDASNQMTQTHPYVRFTAICRRFMSMSEVLDDTVGPWVRGGRAKDLIEASERNAEAMTEACEKLLNYMTHVQTVLEIKSAALDEYDSLRQQARKSGRDKPPFELDSIAPKLLSLVCNGARETAGLIRSFWNSPTSWCGCRALEQDDKHLHYVLGLVDYMRWQILKEFSKLVIMFDDHDDPDSNEPCEAWEKDRTGMDIA
jgi:hypothetical protein